jgi:glycerol-3-phosphate O-acyltransferase
MATEAGVTQAVFPEGGLTKDGRLREPRFGVLDYMLRGFHTDGERDLVFVPIGLNYDRVLEDRTQLLSGDASAIKPGGMRAALRTLRFVGAQCGLLLRSRWHRFGYACVNFGTPISVRSWSAARGVDFDRLAREARQAEVAALGGHLMGEVGRLVPVLPVPLVATVLLREDAAAKGAGWSELELKSAVAELVRSLEARHARLYLPRGDWDYAVSAGLRMLVQRHLVDVTEGLYRARAAETPLLRYYANSIAHLRG